MNEKLVEAVAHKVAPNLWGEPPTTDDYEFVRVVITALAAAIRDDPAVIDMLAKVLTWFDSRDEDFERTWPHARPEGEAMREAIAAWIEGKAP